jgi:hypothetical protein
MVFEIPFVRQAYTQVLAHEMKTAVRMLRAFPQEQLDARGTGCGHSARELAEGFIGHLRRLDAVASGSDWSPAPRGARTRGAILLELESCFLGAHAALESLPAAHWNEVVLSPRGLAPWGQARRGELLWMALRGLARHNRHFSLHLRGGCHGSGFDGADGGARRTAPAIDSAEAMAASA